MSQTKSILHSTTASHVKPNDVNRILNLQFYSQFPAVSQSVAKVARQFAARQNTAYLQTGQRHNPRSQFNCRYESRSKHCKHITKVLLNTAV